MPQHINEARAASRLQQLDLPDTGSGITTHAWQGPAGGLLVLDEVPRPLAMVGESCWLAEPRRGEFGSGSGFLAVHVLGYWFG
jgi:hypothetical protein